MCADNGIMPIIIFIIIMIIIITIRSVEYQYSRIRLFLNYFLSNAFISYTDNINVIIIYK